MFSLEADPDEVCWLQSVDNPWAEPAVVSIDLLPPVPATAAGRQVFSAAQKVLAAAPDLARRPHLLGQALADALPCSMTVLLTSLALELYTATEAEPALCLTTPPALQHLHLASDRSLRLYWAALQLGPAGAQHQAASTKGPEEEVGPGSSPLATPATSPLLGPGPAQAAAATPLALAPPLQSLCPLQPEGTHRQAHAASGPSELSSSSLQAHSPGQLAGSARGWGELDGCGGRAGQPGGEEAPGLLAEAGVALGSLTLDSCFLVFWPDLGCSVQDPARPVALVTDSSQAQLREELGCASHQQAALAQAKARRAHRRLQASGQREAGGQPGTALTLAAGGGWEGEELSPCSSDASVGLA
ncbi:hypothetical protein HaLaN_11455 [Haematococcus lacustris]|uniref:Uncharacterized protein n=1 Tax=Haematococcus lacustris TaxID=44745 RepID=A0A699Z0E0_HAELA|nr:hypothetical protein HaLaN_11455 [Haematococcus lacustris]